MFIQLDEIRTNKIGLDKSESLELNRIAKSSALVFMGRTGGSVLQFSYNLVLARLFGSEFVGLFAFVFSLVNIASTLGQVGTQQTLLRYIPIYRAQQHTALARTLLIFIFALGTVGSLTTMGLLFYYRETIETLAQKPGVASILYILTPVVLPLAITQLASYALQGAKKVIQYTAIREVGLPFIILIAVGLVFVFNAHFTTFLTIYLIASVILGIISLFIVWFEFRELQPANFQITSWEWLMFSIPNAGIALLQTTTGWYETIVVGLFRPVDEVGVFFVALRTALLVNVVLIATNAILSPLIAERWSAGQVDRLQYIYKATTRWCFIVSTPIVISMLISRRELMLLFGSEFSFGGTILALLLLGRLMNSATGGVAQILIMTGSQRIELINVFVHAVLITLGTYWAAKNYGIIGAAIVNSLVVSGMNFIKLFQVWHLLKIHPYEKSYLKSILGAVLAAAVGYSVHSYFSFIPATPLLLLSTLLVSSIYLAALFILGMPAEDRIILQSFKTRVHLLFNHV